MEDLKVSLGQYEEQLSMVQEALRASDAESQDSLRTLKNDLQQLIQLTKESLNAQINDESCKNTNTVENKPTKDTDDEYALFMQEMAESGAYDDQTTQSNEMPICSKEIDSQNEEDKDSDIEEELSTLLGMKCAVYHTHKWGGQPSLHNAMVSAILPRQNDDQFQDLQVRVLFTHPTHSEMLPCPFFLNGECKFDDEKCRYSHGAVVALSNLKEAIEPNFDGIRIGSRILIKLKPPDDEDITVTKKSTEKYQLWHRAIVKSVDSDNRACVAKVEQGTKSGEKRKSGADELHLKFEEIFPLNAEDDESSDSSDSLSDTEYPELKTSKQDCDADLQKELLVEKSLQYKGPTMGEWERHTRGIGSKLMLAMGYVPGAGLGVTGEGRSQPVEARVLPVGKSLDACMEISQKYASGDPLKFEQKLKRLQKKEEERNKRAYEREKDKEKRNVFNFLNRTLGNKPDEDDSKQTSTVDIKQTTNKNLNIEQFKITEETKKLERDILKLNSSITKCPVGSPGHIALSAQLFDKNKDLTSLKNKEQQIAKEQRHRKDKQKMTVF